MTKNLCACGCGGCGGAARTGKAYVHGHNSRKGSNPRWAGGRQVNVSGYVMILDPGHPHADGRGYVLEHVKIVSDLLGKPLPPKAQVHHVNRARSDNHNSNLVACEDQAYHRLLHRRQEAYDGCGNPDFRRCRHCRRWDDPENLYISPNGWMAYHRACRNHALQQKREATA